VKFLKFLKHPNFSDSAWYFSLIPINMAIGSIRVIIILLAIANGASLYEIGLLVALNSGATIVFALFWGRISDFFGLRIRFLLLLFLFSSPIYVLLSFAGTTATLTIVYALLAVFTGGIQPIASMYAVEYREGKNWQKEVIRFNSFLTIGVVVGLVVNTLLALVIPLSWILYFAAGLCIVSAVMLWRTAKEPELPLEREAYSVVTVREEESTLTSSILDYFDIRKIKLPKNFKQLKPIHLLFIISLIHWTGVYAYGVGEVPLMNAIGLSSSMILGINIAENLATVFSFSRLVPKVKMEPKKLVTFMMGTRGALMLAWAGLTIFIANQFVGVFIFPLLLEIAFLLCYGLLWHHVMCYAISQAPPNRKGTTQGELLSIISLANVMGALIGGAVIGAFGFAVGFILSALIAVSALPLLRYIEIEIK
jgi:MFS family permease